jgi:hypothetical protein
MQEGDGITDLPHKGSAPPGNGVLKILQGFPDKVPMQAVEIWQGQQFRLNGVKRDHRSGQRSPLQWRMVRQSQIPFEPDRLDRSAHRWTGI